MYDCYPHILPGQRRCDVSGNRTILERFHEPSTGHSIRELLGESHAAQDALYAKDAEIERLTERLSYANLHEQSANALIEIQEQTIERLESHIRILRADASPETTAALSVLDSEVLKRN